MRVFIAVLFLIFSFQSWTKADDISDFEIEGMSIGDSMLIIMSEKEISEAKDFMYKSDKWASASKVLQNSLFDGIQMEFKSNDPKFIVHSFNAKILYNDRDIKECYVQEKKFVEDLKELFEDSSTYKDYGITAHEGDSSGKSKGSWHAFFLDDESGHIFVSVWIGLRKWVFMTV